MLTFRLTFTRVTRWSANELLGPRVERIGKDGRVQRASKNLPTPALECAIDRSETPIGIWSQYYNPRPTDAVWRLKPLVLSSILRIALNLFKGFLQSSVVCTDEWNAPVSITQFDTHRLGAIDQCIMMIISLHATMTTCHCHCHFVSQSINNNGVVIIHFRNIVAYIPVIQDRDPCALTAMFMFVYITPRRSSRISIVSFYAPDKRANSAISVINLLLRSKGQVWRHRAIELVSATGSIHWRWSAELILVVCQLWCCIFKSLPCADAPQHFCSPTTWFPCEYRYLL